MTQTRPRRYSDQDIATIGITVAGTCILGGLFIETFRRTQTNPAPQPKTLVTVIDMNTFDILADRKVLYNEHREGEEGEFISLSFRDGSYLDLDLKIGDYRIIRQFVK